MAVVAIASASVAYSAAEWATQAAQEDGQGLQQRAEQERILQRINLQLAEDTRLYSIYAGHFYAAVAVRDRATAVRATDPLAAAALDLEFENQSAAQTALGRLFQVASPSVTGDTLTFNPDEALALLKAGDSELRDLDPDARKAAADSLHKRALDLVLTIVALLAALLILTIAQVIDRGARLVAAIGIVLAIAVAGVIGTLDPQIIPGLVVIALSAAGLFSVWWLLPRLRGRLPDWITSEEEGAEAAEASMHGASRSRTIHEGGPFEPSLVEPAGPNETASRFYIVVAMAVLTLVAAFIGYRQAATFHEAAEQTRLAQQFALTALDQEIKGVGQAEAGISAHVLAIETQVAASSARLQHHYWLSIGDDRRAADLDLVVLARDAQAAAAKAVDPVAGTDGTLDYATSPPIGDPYFPNRYLVKAEKDALHQSALQDAANEASADLTSRGRDYTFGLAILAVVLYLLGLSLVLRANALRVVFFGASAVLVLLSLVRVVPALTAPDPVNEAAAEDAATHYSEGLVMFRTATSTDEFKAAADHLQEAIQTRPRFARAYAALANATLLAATPQQSGYASIDDAVSREKAIASLEAARANGADTPDVRLTLGFLLYRQATDPAVQATIDAARLGHAIEVTRAAISDGPPDALYRAIALDNLGVALVAAGQEEQARQTYDASIEYILNIDAQRTRPELWREQIVAGALTDLDNLTSRHNDMRDVVDRMKANLVNKVWSPDGGAGATLHDLTISDFNPLMLQWAATAESGVNLIDQVVVLQWYRFDRTASEWYVLPETSGVATPTAFSANVWYASDSKTPDGYFGQAAMTAANRVTCLADGDQYRLEVYVDGALAGAAAEITVGAGQTRPPGAADLQPMDARDIGLAFCRPSPWTLSSGTKPGLVTGYVEPGGAMAARGMLVFRVQRPWIDGGNEADTAGAFDQVLGASETTSLMPSMTLSTDLTVVEEPWPFYGFTDGIARWYDAGPDGRARIVSVGAPDRSVIVYVVWGPKSDFDLGGLGLRLVDSFRPGQ